MAEYSTSGPSESAVQLISCIKAGNINHEFCHNSHSSDVDQWLLPQQTTNQALSSTAKFEEMLIGSPEVIEAPVHSAGIHCLHLAC